MNSYQLQTPKIKTLFTMLSCVNGNSEQKSNPMP